MSDDKMWKINDYALYEGSYSLTYVIIISINFNTHGGAITRNSENQKWLAFSQWIINFNLHNPWIRII